MIQLWLDGHRMDMGKARVAQTFQVNDINMLSNRQASLTNKIKLPKTPRNVVFFSMLGISGSQSTHPYRKLDAKVTRFGIELMAKGWAVVKETAEFYEVAVYDGWIHFVKAIENKVITDTGISELSHIKNVANIIETWTDTTIPYRYLLADYNGKTETDDAKWNADYLIPSANVKWIWDKIHEFAGHEYEGTVFDTDAFKNLWITYPKPINNETEVLEPSHVWNFTNAVFYAVTSGVFAGLAHYSDFLTHTPVVNNDYFTSSPTVSEEPPAGSVMQCQTAGLYKFDFDITSLEITSPNGNAPSEELEHNIDIVLFRYIEGGGTPITEVLVANIEQLTAVQQTLYINFEEGEQFAIRFMKAGDPNGYFFHWMYRIIGTLDIDVNYFVGQNVNFEEAFIDFSIRDFVNEILWRFALTPFQDKYDKKVKYLTHQEWLQSANVNDWSNSKGKFQRKLSEEYTHGNYAQRNYLRYQYNDKNADHNDYFLSVSNENLDDSKTIIASKIYSPELKKAFILDDYYNVYPFWSKNPKEDGTIEYKDLSNRFYMMIAEPMNSNTHIKSELTTDEDSSWVAWRESFEGLSFRDIVPNFYNPIYGILNNAKLVLADIYLDDLDINKLKFDEIYFIKEENMYAILNKIPNYMDPGIYACELIKVEYVTDNFDDGEVVMPGDESIVINTYFQEPDGLGTFIHSIITQFTFVNYIPASATVYAVQYDDYPTTGSPTGTVLSEAVNVNANSVGISLGVSLEPAEEGWYVVYIEDGDGNISNEEIILVEGSAAPVTPSVSVIITPEDEGYVEPAIRDIVYRFNNFTPTSATLTLQEFDVMTLEDIGEPIVFTGLTLTPDTDHTIADVEFSSVYAFYHCTLDTNYIDLETNLIVPS